MAKSKEKELVIRVPSEVHSWIESERCQKMMKQKEFLLKLLQDARQEKRIPSLFDAKAQSVQPVATGVIPFRFADLFAGIGGFRLALERLGGECVFTSEWNKYAQKTYSAWYGDVPHGDIRSIKPADIPDHDVLAAGFPCQPFSIAGVSKKNSLGRPTGFKDVTQGTLFFHLATIVEIKRPPVLVLENVKNLLSHDEGRTWEVISATLKDLKYWVFHKVIDAAAYVPQHRERVFIVCFDKLTFPQPPAFEFPEPPQGTAPKLRDILEANPPDKYTLSDHLWNYLQEYARRHREKGNGFGFGLADPDGVSRTISARYYKDGSEILIPQGKGNPRRLTPLEAARLMGFPDEKKIIVSDTQAYKQFGNAVVPRVAEAVARKIIPVLEAKFKSNGNGCLLKGRDNHNNKAGAPICSHQLVNVP